MRATGLLRPGEYAEDETDPDLSHIKFPVHVVWRGNDGGVTPVYGVYPNW